MSHAKQLLFSVDEIEIHRDFEIFTETYFVSLGYAADVGDHVCTPVTANEAQRVTDAPIDLIMPTNKRLADWFHITTSPIFRIRRRRPFPFVGGLPLYYGNPGVVSSVYVAVMEGDRRARQAAQTVRDAVEEIPMGGFFEAVGELASAASPQLALVKTAFGLLVKVVEQALLDNRDDIQLTNVFTFKPSNDYLRGSRTIGNQKVSLTVSAEVV